MEITLDKIEGIFLGIAIGDAIGMPVETFSREKIAETYGRVKTYHTPNHHKWFDGEKAGTTTDDTQLSLAVAEGLIQGGFDVDVHVKAHVDAFRETTMGWGHSTRESCRRMANGTPWDQAGIGTDGQGVGNGVVMKIAPLGIVGFNESTQKLAYQINKMTHPTSLSNRATYMHVAAIDFCLRQAFDPSAFLDVVMEAGRLSEKDYEVDTASTNLQNAMWFIKQNHPFQDVFGTAIANFGAGSCYVGNSLPFTYAFFLNNPNSVESLYDVVEAGGDTDSNGSILGGMLGAVNGKSVFPQNLIEELPCHQNILEMAGRFYENILQKARIA